MEKKTLLGLWQEFDYDEHANIIPHKGYDPNSEWVRVDDEYERLDEWQDGIISECNQVELKDLNKTLIIFDSETFDKWMDKLKDELSQSNKEESK